MKKRFNSPQLEQNEYPLIALIGQPNCGKSTLFNVVSGYRSLSTNFAGSTVTYTRSQIRIKNKVFTLVDLPGIYSLLPMDQAEETTRNFILTQNVDIIINVIDASTLSRSLELTLQLLELDIPVVVCLNMMDEATRKGIVIDPEKLSQRLHLPTVSTVAVKGYGIEALFTEVFKVYASPPKRQTLLMSRHVELLIDHLALNIPEQMNPDIPHNPRLLAIKLLEQDSFFEKRLDLDTELRSKVLTARKKLNQQHGTTSEEVISNERHAMAMSIYEKSAHFEKTVLTIRDKIDLILMHPFYGYLIMMLMLFFFFYATFKFGALLERPLLSAVQNFSAGLISMLPSDTMIYRIAFGCIQGIGAGIAIVIPYLVPFLIGMAILEDTGYLSRIAFLMDGLMHKIGLHGTAILPILLGYGCTVPAIMATRILKSSRDRFIAAVIAVLVPCSARMTIILGLVGYYLSGVAAFGLYIFNLIIAVIVGVILAKIFPGNEPGMILEVPKYQYPSVKIILAKTWLRLKDFIIIAWPLLIAGSLVLSVAEWFRLDDAFNLLLRPITWILGLPAAIGTTLIFGVLRKELSLLMLFQTFHTTDILSVMSLTQITVFTVFVMFYFPCLATLGVMSKEIGWKKTLLASLLTSVIALFAALFVRGIGILLAL